MSPLNIYYKNQIDNTTTPLSLYLETGRYDKGSIGFVAPLMKKGSKATDVSIKLSYKTKDCSDLYIKITGIGESEKIVSSDTLRLPDNNDFAAFEQSITLDSALLMKLSIVARGDSNNNAKIWINELDVFINGKHVKEIEAVGKQIKTSIKKSDVVTFDVTDIGNLPFANKKILAIGESIHGSQTFNDAAIDIIKKRIAENNCKLVMLEVPLEFSLYVNRYIDGDPNFKLDYISTYFDSSLLSYNFLSFIEWLKEYNSLSETKVNFWGIDGYYISLEAQTELFNFLHTLNEDVGNDEMKKMCTLLVRSKESLLGECIAVFDANDGFREMLTKSESELVRNRLLSLNDRPSSYRNFINRDSLMFEHVNFMVSNMLAPDETATIFAHLGHAAYRGHIEHVDDEELQPMGYYLKSEYGDNYSSIALLTDGGATLTSAKEIKFAIEQLADSPKGSLEYLMSKLNVNNSFVATDKLTNADFFMYNHIGNRANKSNVFYMVPKARMDGAILFKDIAPIEKLDSVLESDLNQDIKIMRSFKNALDKIKEY